MRPRQFGSLSTAYVLPTEDLMSGDATFTGTDYQARVIAFVAVHILAQRPLRWFAPGEDIPTAVAGETGGPGDDARVEFAGRPAVEVQAKHGCDRQRLIDVVRRIPASGGSVPTSVVLTVDRPRTAKWILADLPLDIRRLRYGRPEEIVETTKSLIASIADLGLPKEALHGLYVIPMDVGLEHEPETKLAAEMLRSVLVNPEQATTAWALLVTDVARMCANKERRTRADLVSLLNGAGAGVRPPTKEDKWDRALDTVRELLEREHAEAALAQLSRIERDLEAGHVAGPASPDVLYRFYQQKGTALLRLGRGREALSCAQKALDTKPEGVLGLITASYAAASLGELDLAHTYAERATSTDRDEPRAWGALAYVAAARAELLPSPPERIARSPRYLFALAQVAGAAGNDAEVLRLTSELFKQGDRRPYVIFLRTNALVDGSSSSQSDAERFGEVERLTTEAIDSLTGEFHPLVPKFHILRAAARRKLGRPTEADTDVAAARALAEGDLDAIRYEAMARLSSGNEQAALEVLRHPGVAGSAELLSMRAQVSAVSDDPESARRDGLAALAQVNDAHHPNLVRMGVAEVALVLGDVSWADRVLSEVSTSAREDSRYKVLLGKAAIARGDVDAGIAILRDAAAGPGLAPQGLKKSFAAIELGEALIRVKRPADAVKVLGAIPHDEMPEHAQRLYGAALIATGEFERAQEFLTELQAEGALPGWALAMATEIALLREDSDAAIQHLTVLVGKGEPARGARVQLARLLIEGGRPADAQPHIDQLLSSSELTPEQRMQGAQLLHLSGREAEALPLAYAAFRQGSGDARLHQAFVMMVLLSKLHIERPQVVGSDTAVRLADSTGQERVYVIRGDTSPDRTKKEITSEEAAGLGLVGKSVGDVVTIRTALKETSWTINEILPVMLWEAQDAAMHYEERFPSEPFFVAGMQMGDGSSVADLVPIISSLHSRRAFAEHVLLQYQQNVLPLGLVAKLLGGSIANAMTAITLDPSATLFLFAEWSDEAGIKESRAQATAPRIVLTRSALKTISDLDLLGLVSGEYKLVSPRSLREELKVELAEAEKLVAEGQHVMSSAGDTLRIDDIPAGAPILVENREQIEKVLTWVTSNATIEPRPLSMVGATGSQHEELRDSIGRSSFDALALSLVQRVPFLTDDLGLRRVTIRGQQASSFSTVALLEELTARGVLEQHRCDQILVELANRKFVSVPATRGAIEAGLRQSRDIGEDGLGRVFGTLAHRRSDPRAPAVIVAQVIRSQVLAGVQTVSISQIVDRSLAAMTPAWGAVPSAQAVAQAAAVELPLLPEALDEVLRCCRQFVGRHLAAVTKLPVTKG